MIGFVPLPPCPSCGYPSDRDGRPCSTCVQDELRALADAMRNAGASIGDMMDDWAANQRVLAEACEIASSIDVERQELEREALTNPGLAIVLYGFEAAPIGAVERVEGDTIWVGFDAAVSAAIGGVAQIGQAFEAAVRQTIQVAAATNEHAEQLRRQLTELGEAFAEELEPLPPRLPVVGFLKDAYEWVCDQVVGARAWLWRVVHPP